MNLEATILSKEGIDGSMGINPIVNIAEQPHFMTDGMLLDDILMCLIQESG